MLKRHIFGGLFVVCGLALSSCTIGTIPGAPAPEAATASTAVVPTGGFGAMLNSQRASTGLPAATPDARLTAAAQAHAEDMVAQDYFSHTGLDGRSSADRVRAAGYSSCRPSENIAFGQQSESEVFQTWVNSPPHLANIMMNGPVQYGLGHAGTKWVLVVAGVC
jgi:uncharacterized protein YkwD